MSELKIFRAKYIYPVSSPVIEDGIVATAKGRIIAVGPYRQLKDLGVVFDLGEVVLMPALVNAHVHLELSALKWRLTPTGSFISWVKSLIKGRTEVGEDEAKEAAWQAVREMWHEGVGVIADIGNTPLALSALESSPVEGIFFREIINFRNGSREFNELVGLGRTPGIRISLSAHSPYTVSPLLLQAIKAWTRSRRSIFSIHVAECPEEVLFLKEGSGPIRFLLEERGQWNPSFRPPEMSPVAYLHSLGLLDQRTLCVHVVQVDLEDLELISRTGASVCLCPRSNTFLGVGLPPVERFLALGIRPALGTDSLASNDRLSIFAEMATVARFFPRIPPEEIIKMGTIYGARALGLERDWGSLEQGKRATFLSLRIDGLGLAAEDLAGFLTTSSHPPELSWIYG